LNELTLVMYFLSSYCQLAYYIHAIILVCGLLLYLTTDLSKRTRIFRHSHGHTYII